MTSIARAAPTLPKPRALVLIDPRGAFLAVAARPLWGLGVVFMLAFAVVPPLVFVARADTSAIVKRELNKSGKLDAVPAEQREQVIEVGGKGMVFALPAAAAAKRAIWMTIVTLVCLGLLKGSRPELTMSPVAGAVAVAMAPVALHDTFVALAFLFKDPMQLDAQNAVLSNPAAWLGLDAGHTVAGALLHGLDFFELWSAALLGLGVNVVAGTRSSLPYLVAFGGQAIATAIGAIGPALS
jgi:hypothetical protein